MPNFLTLSFAILFPCLGLAGQALTTHFYDKPDGSEGGLSVKVTPIQGLENAVVVEATEYKVYQAHIDAQAGTVSLRGLPPGRYDLLLKYGDRIYEGVTFEETGDYVRLPKSDVDYIQWEIWRSEDYFNKKQIGRMGGNARTVKLVVEDIRDKLTFEPDGTPMKGLLIRRLEIWELRKTGQVWQTKKCKHLFREERPIPTPELGAPFCTFYYVPALGGIRVGDSVVTVPPFDTAAARPGLPPHFCRATHVEKAKK